MPPTTGRIARFVTPFAVVLAAAIAVLGSRSNLVTDPAAEYTVRSLAVIAVLGAVACWWRGGERGAVAVPAAASAIAAMALASALQGSIYAPGGIGADQSFRTAAVTRFSTTWRNADFAVDGLPSFYPPAYFWVLGRLGRLFDVEPWLMLKLGVLAIAFALPFLAFLLWRRVLPVQLAAVTAVAPIVVADVYEPYAWLVLGLFMPWWIEVAGGVGSTRSNRAALGLGLVGSLLLMTYWYQFVVGALAAAILLVADLVRHDLDRDRWGWTAKVAGVTLVGSAVYWAPAALSVLAAEQPDPSGSRWFNADHGRVPLPMVAATPVGAIALAGLVWLALRLGAEPLARGLAALLAAAYSWFLLGALAAAIDRPLLSFRGKPMVPLVLVSAGIVGVAALTRRAIDRYGEARRVAVVVAALLGIAITQQFIESLRVSDHVTEALNTPRGVLVRPDTGGPDGPIRDAVGDDAVVLTDRIDLLIGYGFYAFVPWHVHYANPAAEYGARIEFLRELATSPDADRFATTASDNRFGAIDAFVLREDGDALVFDFTVDAFPNGFTSDAIRFPRRLFDRYSLSPLDEHVLAVPAP